jgi:hypothetical protein
VGEPGPPKQEEVGSAETAPLAIGEPGPSQQEEVGVAEAEGGLPGEVPQGTTPQLTEEGQKEPKMAVKYKKSDLSEEGRRASTNNYCISAKGRG